MSKSYTPHAVALLLVAEIVSRDVRGKKWTDSAVQKQVVFFLKGGRPLTCGGQICMLDTLLNVITEVASQTTQFSNNPIEVDFYLNIDQIAHLADALNAHAVVCSQIDGKKVIAGNTISVVDLTYRWGVVDNKKTGLDAPRSKTAFTGGRAMFKTGYRPLAGHTAVNSGLKTTDKVVINPIIAVTADLTQDPDRTGIYLGDYSHWEWVENNQEAESFCLEIDPHLPKTPYDDCVLRGKLRNVLLSGSGSTSDVVIGNKVVWSPRGIFDFGTEGAILGLKAVAIGVKNKIAPKNGKPYTSLRCSFVALIPFTLGNSKKKFFAASSAKKEIIEIPHSIVKAVEITPVAETPTTTTTPTTTAKKEEKTSSTEENDVSCVLDVSAVNLNRNPQPDFSDVDVDNLPDIL